MEVLNHVIYETVEQVALVSINRPERCNALNFVVIEELKQVFTEILNREDLKIVVLRAVGDSFCSGLDLDYLRELQGYDLEANVFDSKNLFELFALMQQLGKPIVAKAQGLALSSGIGLLLASDVCIADQNTVFGFRDVKLGLIPANIALLLGNKIGMGRAKYLLLTGEPFGADEAWALGIVHKVVPSHLLDSTVLQTALKMCNENGREAMQLTKRLFADFPSLPASDQVQLANRMNAHGRLTEESKMVIEHMTKNKTKN